MTLIHFWLSEDSGIIDISSFGILTFLKLACPDLKFNDDSWDMDV